MKDCKLPQVAIIIPAFNAEASIRRCVLSAIEQSYPATEVIVINDGSTDATGKMLEELKMHRGNLVVLHHHVNQGVSRSRNLGIETSSAPWVTFLDADDYLAPNYVSDVMGSNTTEDFIFTPYIQVDPLSGPSFKNHSICMSSLFTDDKLLEYLEEYCHRPYVFTGLVHCWNKFFSKCLLEDHQIFFDEDLNQLEDVNFVFRYLHFAEKKKFINIAGVYHEVNRAGTNLSALSGAALDAPTKLVKALEPVRSLKEQLLKKCKAQEKVRFEHFRTSMVVLFCIRMSRRFKRKIDFSLIRNIYRWLGAETTRQDASHFLHVSGESLPLWIALKQRAPWVGTLILLLGRH